MNKKCAFRALLGVLLVGLLTACRSPQTARGAAPARPAFLDAADQVALWMDTPVTASSLRGRVTVRCGAQTVAVARVDVARDAAEEVVLAGTLQSALGGADWQPDGAQTRMTESAPGVFQFQARLPQGSYQYKVARGGGWADNYGKDFQPGGANLTLTVPAADTPVLFRVDFNKKTIQTSLDTPGLAAFPGGPPPPLAGHALRLVLARRITPAEIARPLSVRFADGTSRPVFARDVLSDPAYFYGGADLGAGYSHAQTTFKVWSPVSSSAELLLYPDAAGPAARRLPLRRGAAGVWSATVPGDLHGTYYQYRFTSYGIVRTTADIYGHAASPDLQRSMVVDLARTDPADWQRVPAPRLAHPTDAVAYELHLRDFTVDPSGGVPADRRGKYRGLVTPGTRVSGAARPTGLDYLRALGVTHVQVMPFQSIAPESGDGYNWGYATDLFDVPEPRYAAHPEDPASVIREVKTMVVGLHRAGLGLVMDVVYNHAVPSDGDGSPFQATVPGYYFRTGPQGELLNESGVGNALNDDRPMVRKFVCDSLAYWATQYRVDGFRFDLLGMFTPRTVAAISRTLHAVRPDILLYGEPWTGGGPTRFGKGAQRGLGVAVFNDNIRNLLRGDTDGTRPGFALGGGADSGALQTALRGSPDFTRAPTETANFVSIHDNMTLWDKITKTLPGDDATDRRALKLAGAMVLLSQGVPVLEGGAELGRTKGGSDNSYDRGDAVNRCDWARGLQFADVSEYYAGLIALRRAHPAFRRATAAGVADTMTFLPADSLPAKTVAFTLDGGPSGDSWHKTLVVFHGATAADTWTLPPGAWRLAVSADRARTRGDAVPAPLAFSCATFRVCAVPGTTFRWGPPSRWGVSRKAAGERENKNRRLRSLLAPRYRALLSSLLPSPASRGRSSVRRMSPAVELCEQGRLASSPPDGYFHARLHGRGLPPLCGYTMQRDVASPITGGPGGPLALTPPCGILMKRDVSPYREGGPGDCAPKEAKKQ